MFKYVRMFYNPETNVIDGLDLIQPAEKNRVSLPINSFVDLLDLRQLLDEMIIAAREVREEFRKQNETKDFQYGNKD